MVREYSAKFLKVVGLDVELLEGVFLICLVGHYDLFGGAILGLI
jgi:hypothetical protein